MQCAVMSKMWNEGKMEVHVPGKTRKHYFLVFTSLGVFWVWQLITKPVILCNKSQMLHLAAHSHPLTMKYEEYNCYTGSPHNIMIEDKDSKKMSWPRGHNPQ